jgi:hypothetical protein
MFLLANAAADEAIGSHAVGQKRLVNDGIEDSDPQVLSDATPRKSLTEQQTQFTEEFDDGYELPSEKKLIGVEQSKLTPQPEQHTTTSSVQTTLKTVQHTWLGPTGHNTHLLTTPDTVRYSTAVPQYDIPC